MGITATAHHMSFPVRDLERSRRFYQDVLGLAQIARPELGVAGLWYGAGACEVHLIEVPEGIEVGAPPPRLLPLDRHAAFAVAEYAETREHLLRHGLEIVENPGAGQMWVRDPDGHIIELIVAAR